MRVEYTPIPILFDQISWPVVAKRGGYIDRIDQGVKNHMSSTLNCDSGGRSCAILFSGDWSCWLLHADSWRFTSGLRM